MIWSVVNFVLNSNEQVISCCSELVSFIFRHKYGIRLGSSNDVYTLANEVTIERHPRPDGGVKPVVNLDFFIVVCASADRRSARATACVPQVPVRC